MSSMTMSMSVRHILGFDRTDTEWQQARAGGWRRADLRWERLSEAAITAWQNGRRWRARILFYAAFWQTRLAFEGNDRRIATSLINLGITAGASSARGRAFFTQAQGAWQAARGDVDTMVVQPRSRSSLFHLRMEARHRDTFLANSRLRISRIIVETGESLDALALGTGTLAYRHFSRWRGERPTVFDDMRKILGACLLIANPVGEDDRNRRP